MHPEDKYTFNGPIFIVGRPRSGTKLLRSLLNGHSRISIPFWESNFIPRYINKHHEFGNIETFKNFVKFFKFFEKIEFFRKINNHPEYAGIVECNQWYSEIKDYSYSGAISAFFKMYAKRENKSIWGDKSPGYMLYSKELKKLFPESKFIHIIRDVRDHCLSIMNAWNWNPYRAAQYWNDSIKKCRKDARSFLKNDYYEIKYENLIENPDVELVKLCKFLNINYENKMQQMDKPTENLGDAKGAKIILSQNKTKWHHKMSDNMVRKIETISFEMLIGLNYEIFYAKKGKRLTRKEMMITRAQDTLNRFKFDCKYQGGFLKAVEYRFMKKRYG